MTIPSVSFVVACLGLAVATLPAAAQGTPEQRKACAPDAVSLCPNEIPDVARTTACMKAHRASLSAACRAVFDAATGGAPAASKRTADKADPEDAKPASRARVVTTERVRPSRRGRAAAVERTDGETAYVERGERIPGSEDFDAAANARRGGRAVETREAVYAPGDSAPACLSPYVPAEACRLVPPIVGLTR